MRVRTQAPRNALQAGFTLIELIIVIVIIGILAAIALPKFQDLTTAATKSATKGLAGELAAATAINYAKIKGEGGTYTAPTCSADSLKLLLQGGVWPTGYIVTPGTGGDCALASTADASSPITFNIPQ